MADDPVVLALRAALATGDSLEIRIALADRLVTIADHARALVEYEHALQLAPSNAAALDGARRAAAAVGDDVKAGAYSMAARAGVATVAAPREAPILRLVPRSDDAPAEVGEARVTFADVGGMEAVKAKIERAFLAPTRNPELYKSFGREIRGGLVLFGPPGCGKTFIARALAGEIGAKFFDIGISDVLDMWLGESEKKLHALFENARRDQPSVIFFDEVDALGQRRTTLKGSAGRTLVNQLLSELDGSGARNKGLFVLGATNHPWDLDPALRRPGRFDQLVFVPPPDALARQSILELKLAGRPVAPKLDLRKVAASTEGFSGADLQAVVDQATDAAIERSMRDAIQVPIDDAALLRAAREIKPSTRAWFESARNYAVYANEGGMLDELLAYLKKGGDGVTMELSEAACARAHAAIELHRYEVAAEEARGAIAADPTNADAHALLAQALSAQGDKQEALAAVIGGLAIDPEHEWLHRVRANVLLALGNVDGALAASDEVLRLAPSAPAYGLRASILHSKRDLAGAREACRQSLEHDPHHAWVHCMLGDVELDAGDAKAAEAAYRAALAIEPHTASALNNLGVALQRQKREEEAVLAFKSAMLVDPTLAVAKRNTHASVKNLTGTAAVAGAGVIGLLIKLMAVGGTRAGIAATSPHTDSDDLTNTIVAVILIVVGVILLLAFGLWLVKKQLAKARVKRLDPQLWELFQQLERDRKAGRLA